MPINYYSIILEKPLRIKFDDDIINEAFNYKTRKKMHKLNYIYKSPLIEKMSISKQNSDMYKKKEKKKTRKNR